MRLAVVGIGKMGAGIAGRLLRHGHEVVAYDLLAENVKGVAEMGAIPAASLAQAVEQLAGPPRVIWLMLPAGEAVTGTLQQLALLLGEGDILIEGGNSNYRASQERAGMLRFKGIHMLDVGVSGGVWGSECGFNLMVGGDREAFEAVEPLFAALAAPGGYAYLGPSGAGHFAKMVHNGIEYGMMQAVAEGFELLAAKGEFGYDLAKLARLWGAGSVIRSWLLDLTADVLGEDSSLDWVEPYVVDTGEGRWMVQESLEMGIPVPVISLALQMRFQSRQQDSFAARLLASLRSRFGGHEVRRRWAKGQEGV